MNARQCAWMLGKLQQIVDYLKLLPQTPRTTQARTKLREAMQLINEDVES